MISHLDKVNLCLQMLLAILISQELSYLHFLKTLASRGLFLGLQAKLPLACTVCVSESAASILGILHPLCATGDLPVYLCKWLQCQACLAWPPQLCRQGAVACMLLPDLY